MAPDVGHLSVERLIEHFLPVRAGEIESAFDDIWREASSGALDSSSVRLRISNVLTWGLEQEAGDRFEHLMDALAQQHPCRGILAAQADDATQVESAISAHCWRTASGGKHICSEEILLRASPRMHNELASAVLALLVPELPVHLWLVGDPDVPRRVPDEILEVADRLYVDSSSGAVVANSFTAIQSTASEDGNLQVVDLAWQRGEPWRELTAQLFDGRAGELIDRIASIEVIGGSASVSSGALLLAGWLISRLDLTPATIESANTRVVATFYDGSRPVVVQISPSAAGIELESVALHTDAATLTVEFHRESGHMHVRSDWANEPVRRAVAAEPTDDAAVLTVAIQGPTDPAMYTAALRVAVALAG